MTRIIYFSTTYSPHDHRFLSALAKTEHQVYFVRLTRGKNESEDRIIPTEIEQVIWEGGQREFRWRDIPGYARGLRRVIKRIQPDVLHAGPIQTVGLVAVLTGFRPILTMSWGFDLMEDVHRNKWWEWVTRFVLKRSTFFTSDAQVTRDKAIEYGMNPERTIVFPWGVDLEHFKPSDSAIQRINATTNQRTNESTNQRNNETTRKRNNEKTKQRENETTKQRNNEITLFCNRSWEPRYGVDVLAKAFVRAAKSKPNLSLILLAGGSQAGAIRRILTSGGVMERVHFGGYIKQKDLPRYYHMADVYISPSHVDGSSVSLMEAMACGLPCLVSDIPANKEWVTEDENGWLFPDGDADALAEKILRVAENRDTLDEIGANSRRVAEESADWQKNFQKLLQAYELTAKLK